MQFLELDTFPEEFDNKRVLEVGSRDFNGSARIIINRFKVKEYIGTDSIYDKGVDIVCNAENLVSTFGENSFDTVISTETIEHILDWKSAINNIKAVLKPDGDLFITTRSFGFGYHGNVFYDDYWRYSMDDMKKIFSDFKIVTLIPDCSMSGLFLKAIKPVDWSPVDLSDIKLFEVQKD